MKRRIKKMDNVRVIRTGCKCEECPNFDTCDRESIFYEIKGAIIDGVFMIVFAILGGIIAMAIYGLFR